MSHGGGPKIDPRRLRYAQRFGIDLHSHHKLTHKLMDQLDRCVDDMARRIILRGLGDH